MIIELIIGQLLLAVFNIINSIFDAYRILKHKTIAHAINFGAYLIYACILCVVLKIPIYFLWNVIPCGPAVLFLIASFFNRQFSFDIPLNLRRGLKWYYQSQANPPAALLDRIERSFFGTGEFVGKEIFEFYLICYCVTISAWVWIVK